MATGNFHNVNSSNIYVPNCTDFLSDDLKSVIEDFYEDDTIKSEEELRSYPTFSLGSVQNGFEFLGLEVDIRVNIFFRSGYYEAGNLDYESQIYINGEEFEFDEISDIEPDWYDIKPGIWAIHKDNLISRVQKMLDTLISDVESGFEKISTPYGIAARFSNGETIYSRV